MSHWRRARSRAACVLLALACVAGCGDKRSEPKKGSAAGSAATKKRMSPKAAAQETVLLWDASVQKMQEEVAKAEAEGNAAKAEDFRQKLEISRMGLEQAKKKLQILETAEADARRAGSASSGTP